MIGELLRSTGLEPLDAELLMAHVLSRDRTWVFAHPEALLSEIEQKAFLDLVTRRQQRVPIAYLLGEQEFYGRPFTVDPHVLIPRPSTEALIDEVKRLLDRKHQYTSILVFPPLTPTDTGIVIFTYLKQALSTIPSPASIIDVGTGSGCIGITIALEIPEIHVIGTDTSKNALKVARENAVRHRIYDRISFQQSDLLADNLMEHANFETPFLVVSNPPYLPEGTPLPPDVLNYEPHSALFAGPDGMDVLRPLFAQCIEQPQCIGCVLECRSEQAATLARQLSNSAV
jgi:release factor glutamine methyltransferase